MNKLNNYFRRDNQRKRERADGQGGFTLIELLITLSVIAILGVISSSQIVKASEETLAEGSGEYLRRVSAAAEKHTLLYYQEYVNGSAIPGVVNPLKPTVAELVALGTLNAGFPSGPNSMPTRQSLEINISKKGTCPGTDCVLTALVCTTTPVNLGGTATRFDLAQTMVDRQGGTGGQSVVNNGAVIHGPAMTASNPIAGNPEGIVCGSSLINTALFDRFVRVKDTRDPDLQGALTVAGATTLNGATKINNNATITGALTAASASITGDLKAGTANVTGALTAASASITGKAAAAYFTPTGVYAVGSACTDDGSIGKLSGATGLVVCQGGTWRTLTSTVAPDSVCNPEGSMATSSTGVSLLCVNGKYRAMNTIIRYGAVGTACTDAGSTAINTENKNEMVICRANLAGGSLRYMSLKDVTQHLSFVRAEEVTDWTISGQTVAKPVCSPSPGQTAFEIIQLIPKTVSTKDGGIAIYATDEGTAWKIWLRNGSDTVLGTGATAVAQISCYFP